MKKIITGLILLTFLGVNFSFVFAKTDFNNNFNNNYNNGFNNTYNNGFNNGYNNNYNNGFNNRFNNGYDPLTWHINCYNPEVKIKERFGIDPYAVGTPETSRPITGFQLIDDGVGGGGFLCPKTSSKNGIYFRNSTIPHLFKFPVPQIADMGIIELFFNKDIIATIYPESDYFRSGIFASAMNNKDQVAGTYLDNGLPGSEKGRPFIWENGVTTINKCCGPRSGAFNINDQGFVVVSGNGGNFLSKDGIRIDLKSGDFILAQPYFIDNNNFITGSAFNTKDLKTHLVHWIPIYAP